MALAWSAFGPTLSAANPLAVGLSKGPGTCHTNLRQHSIIRCGIVDDSGESGEGGQLKTAKATSQSPSWVHPDPATVDAYAGWAPFYTDSEGHKLGGILKLGAGLALAVGFSLVTYAAYARKGHIHGVLDTVATQEQLPSCSNTEDTSDAINSLGSVSSKLHSSVESTKELVEENPHFDVGSDSDLHQKKAAPGQDSFLSEEVADVSDDKDNLSAELSSTTDLRSYANAAEVDHVAMFHAAETQCTASSSNVKPVVDEIDEIASDLNESGLSCADMFGSPKSLPDGSDADQPSSKSYTATYVLDNENEGNLSPSLENTGVAEPNKPELSDPAVIDDKTPNSAELQAGKGSEISVSALLHIPSRSVQQGILGDILCTLDDIHPIISEPGYVTKSTTVIETPSSSLGSEYWQFKSVGIPAPSTPSAAASEKMGRVVVPTIVDHEQEQALAALQALKVIELGVDPGGICSRREYARWLIVASSALARNYAHKVFPAMYIENVSELAFDDISPRDPDFPYIQGLAEAGLISSKLSRPERNVEGGGSTNFAPDSPVSRLDLVSWKVALDGCNIEGLDLERLQSQSGFIDADKISEEAWPFIAADLSAGDHSIIGTSFGYTRRFQPDKPVTRAQAAVALSTGEAADAVAEELTRIEAEIMAEAAVEAEFALQARAQTQVDAYFNTELKLEKELRLSAEKALEEVTEALVKMKNERDKEKYTLLKNQALVEAEQELLQKLRQELDSQIEGLAVCRVEVVYERNRLSALKMEKEAESQALASCRSELEVEKKALVLARLWAEEEANRARSHAKLLEKARKRWEGQGIPVNVEKELNDDNIPALSWQFSGSRTRLNSFLERPPVQDILERAGQMKAQVVKKFFLVVQAAGRALILLRERAVGLLQNVGAKAHAFQQDSWAIATRKVHNVQDATSSTVSSLSSTISERTKKIADGATVSRLSSNISEEAKKMAACAREGAERLVQKFKS